MSPTRFTCSTPASAMTARRMLSSQAATRSGSSSEPSDSKKRAAGIAAAVSGAGPTVLALTDTANAPRVATLAGARFETSTLSVDVDGARVVALDS